jgi:hypothetical protein
MKKPSLAFHWHVNQGGLLFLRQAKGNNLNLRKTSARISKNKLRVNRTGAPQPIKHDAGSAIRVRHLFGCLANIGNLGWGGGRRAIQP